MSASKSRLHEFLGRPLFFFPWRFQDRACLVMLVEGFQRVWPIHLHRLIMISASAGLWLVLCHSFSLLMVIGQRIRKILHRHELIKVCTFFVVATVVLQVSEPYNRTGLTLLLKILILVGSVRSLELQTFFYCRKTALALPILALTSVSLDVNYTAQIGKGFTSSNKSSFSRTGSVITVLILRTLVFPLLM